jgi:hypothetical protein
VVHQQEELTKMKKVIMFLFAAIFLFSLTSTVSATFNNLLDTGLVVSYNLSEGTGVSAADSVVANGSKNITWTNSGGWSAGVVNSGFSPNSSTYYGNTSIPLGSSITGNDFSVSFWVYFNGTAVPDYSIIMSNHWGLTGANDWYFGTYGTNTTGFAFNDVNPFTQTNNITYRQWTNYVLTHSNGGAITVYKNGKFLATGGAVGSNMGLSTSEKLTVFRPAMNGFSVPQGVTIDEIYFWNRTLNSTEILLANSTFNNYSAGGGSSTPFNVSLVSDNSSVGVYPKNNTPVFHTAYWQSNVSLSHYIFSTNYTGVWVNDSATSFASGILTPLLSPLEPKSGNLASTNWNGSLDEVTSWWYLSQYNSTQIITNNLWVPWYTDSQFCDVAHLHTDSQSGSYSSPNMTHNNMVSDEFSQVGVVLSMGTNETRFEQFYNTLGVIDECGAGNLSCWNVKRNATSIITGVVNDTASDADARSITALYNAATNPYFSATNRSKYLAKANVMASDFVAYEIVQQCYPSSLGQGPICYWMAGGKDAKNGGLTANNFGYSGYFQDGVIAMLQAYIATGNATYLAISKNITLNYLEAAKWNGTDFSVSPGLAFKWNITPTIPEAICTNTCSPVMWDGADAPRANIFGPAEYILNLTGNNMSILSGYMANWRTRYMRNTNSVPLQFYPNGTIAAGTSNQSGYFAQGIQSSGLFGYWNISAYNETIKNAWGHFDSTPKSADYGTCMGVYGQYFPLMSLGVAIGRNLNSFGSTSVSTTGRTNVTRLIKGTVGNVTSWILYVNNSESVVLSTTLMSYTLVNSAPTSSNALVSPISLTQNQTVSINVTIGDDDGLNTISVVKATITVPSTTRSTTTPASSINYTKWVSNPLNLTVPNSFCGSYIAAETTNIYENGTIHMWFRCSNTGDTRTYIFYTNSSNGVNFTTPINVTSPWGPSFPNFGMPYALKINNSYYMMATQLNATPNKVIYMFNSSDKVNWGNACGTGSLLASGGVHLQNPSWYYNSTNGYAYGLIEQGTGPFSLNYWNATSICGGWADQGQVYSNGGNAWITYLNNKFVVYYGNTNLGGAWRFNLAEGSALNSLTTIYPYVLNVTQGWENTHISDPDIAIIDDGNTSFLSQMFLYYLGDQNRTGASYDSQNRSFLDVHFPINTSLTNETNVTLSRFSPTSSIWNGTYSNTTNYAIYNLTYVFVNDTSNAMNFSVYNTVSFNVSAHGLSAVLTSPANYYNATLNNVNFEGTVSSSSNITNVSLLWNGVVNQTNTSGISGSYTFSQEILSDGVNTWGLRVCDDLPLCADSATRTIYKDAHGPTITVHSPADGATYTINNVTFIANVSDTVSVSNVSILINGVINSTNTTGANNVNYTFTINNFANSTFTWAIQACDSIRCNLSSNRTFTTGVAAPSVSLTSPVDNYNASTSSLTLVGSVSSSYAITNVSLVWNGVREQTNTSGISGTYTFSKTSATDGSQVWSIEACNIYGCSIATNRSLSIDTSRPVINLTAPTGTLFYNLNNTPATTFLNWTVSDATLQSCWYVYNNTNYSVSGRENLPGAWFDGNISSYATTGLNNISFIVNGNVNTFTVNHIYNSGGGSDENRVDYIDLTRLEKTNGNYSLSMNYTGGCNIRLMGNASSSPVTLSTYQYLAPGCFSIGSYDRISELSTSKQFVTCSINTTQFSLNPYINNLTFYANDTYGNEANSTIAWNYGMSYLNFSYTSSVVESSREYFSTAVMYNSTQWSSSSMKIYYNGTGYTASSTGTGNTLFYNKSLNIPAVSSNANASFYWSLTLTNSTGSFIYNSSSFTQSITLVNFSLCDYSPNSTQIFFNVVSTLNTSLPVNASFVSTWNISASDDPSISLTRSYQDTTENHSTFGFCISPLNQNYTTTLDIVVDAAGYTATSHYITGASYGIPGVNQTLYLLPDNSSTLTELIVTDWDYDPVENAYITVQRYDLLTDSYYSVAMARTSYLGSDLIYTEWYNSWYKFIVVVGGEAVGTYGPVKISESPLSFRLGQESISNYTKFNDFQYTLTYSNTSNNFILTFIKPSGQVDSGCLRVTKRNVTNDYAICNVCDTSSSATLYCNVAGYGNGTFIADFYATGSFQWIDTIVETIGAQNALYNMIGNDNATGMAIILAGVVLSFFLITPAVAVFGMIIAMLATFALGFQPFDYMAFIGIVLLGGAVIWAVKR